MRLVLLLALAVLTAGCAGSNDDDTPGGSTTTTTTPAGTTATMPAGGDDKTCESTKDASKKAQEPVVELNTSQGTIRMKLFCDKAPMTTQHIAKLVEAGCYDGTRFHRVVRGFMNQGGDPTTKDPNAQGGGGGPSDCGQSPDTIAEEYYCADGTVSTMTPAGSQPATQCDAHGGLALKHDKPGVWSMARTSVPHTSGSQFFITAAPASFLDGRYTVFGHVADEASLGVVRKINNLTCGARACTDPPQGSSRTDVPVTIHTATISWS